MPEEAAPGGGGGEGATHPDPQAQLTKAEEGALRRAFDAFDVE